MTTDDEREWARLTAAPEHAEFTGKEHTALRVVGWVIIYLTFAPPLAVLLWRLALSPWLD